MTAYEIRLIVAADILHNKFLAIGEHFAATQKDEASLSTQKCCTRSVLMSSYWAMFDEQSNFAVFLPRYFVDDAIFYFGELILCAIP